MRTKMEIKDALRPMSKALLAGKRPSPINFMGYTIKCQRLYNATGCTGPAWNVDFSVIAHDPDQDRIVMGGGLLDTVNALYTTQTMTRRGYFFTEAA